MYKMLRTCMDFICFILILTRPLSDHVLDFIYRLIMGKTKVLPPIDNKILLMTATELAEKIRKRQLTCEEVMTAFVQRSKAVHMYVNAAVDERYEDAVKEAKEVDRFLSGGTKSEEQIAKETPLLGVPFSCKETVGVKGMIQCNGVVRKKDRRSPKDSAAAALYRKAGAIPYVVTNVPLSCLWWETANQAFGLTKNPYNNVRTVGGSSGGEAAIISSAASVIGIGNDSAGSIRIPGSYCGIYGHKPSKYLVSNEGVFPPAEKIWDEILTPGPMCRYAQDLPLLARLLSSNNANIKWDEKVDFREVKVYYMEELPGFINKAVPDIKAAVCKAVKHFENEYGIKPARIEIDDLRHAFNFWECRMLEFGGMQIPSLLAEDGKINLWWELIKCLFRCSDHTLPAIYFAMIEHSEKDEFYHKYLQIFKEVERKFEEILEGDAILLVPTMPEPAPHYLITIPKLPHLGYTCFPSCLGYPATQIPAGMSNKLPFGLQVISRHFQDHLTIAAGLELEKVFGGWRSPCLVSA